MATHPLFSLEYTRQTERLPNLWSVESGHKMELFGNSFHPLNITRVYVVKDTVAFTFVTVNENKGYFFMENERNLGQSGVLIQNLWMDENAVLRDMGIDAPPNIQIPTGIQGTSCVQGVIEKKGTHNIAYLKFLKSSPLCPKTPDCRFVDNMLALMFAFLMEISFDGIIVLDDDVIKNNVRLLLFRIMVGAKYASIYEQYGFEPRYPEKAKAVKEAILSHDQCKANSKNVTEKYTLCDSLLKDRGLMKNLIDAFKHMVNTNFRKVALRCKIEFEM